MLEVFLFTVAFLWLVWAAFAVMIWKENAPVRQFNREWSAFERYLQAKEDAKGFET